MSELLRLHPAVNLTFIDTNRVQIRAVADQVTVNKGAQLIAALVPLCDGTRSEDALCEQLSSSGFSKASVKAAIDFFRSRGYFANFDGAQPADALAAQLDWLASKMPEDRFDNRLTGRTASEVIVRLLTAGVLADCVAAVVREQGFSLTFGGASSGYSAIDVYCTDWDDHAGALAHNRGNVLQGAPTLYATLDEGRARVGPFVLPGQTPCYECFHHRIRSSVTFVDEFDCRVGLKREELPVVERSCSSPSRLYAWVVAGMVGAELLKYMRKLTQFSALGRIVEVDLLRSQMTTGRVLRLPRCGVCGRAKAHSAPTLAVRDLI
jgi:bacteriocin biosynthesis cyclodehydratase domain-containing protein